MQQVIFQLMCILFCSALLGAGATFEFEGGRENVYDDDDENDDDVVDFNEEGLKQNPWENKKFSTLKTEMDQISPYLYKKVCKIISIFFILFLHT